MAAGDEEAKAKENFRSRWATRSSPACSTSLLQDLRWCRRSLRLRPSRLRRQGQPQSFKRQHFVLNEGMLEVECPSVTRRRSSALRRQFTDLMVKDLKTGDCFRSRTLVEDNLRILDPMLSPPSVAASRGCRRDWRFCLEERHSHDASPGTKSPETRTIFWPYPFNLMFPTQIGPSSNAQGSQPETAQGSQLATLLYCQRRGSPRCCAGRAVLPQRDRPALVSSAEAPPRRRLSDFVHPSARSTQSLGGGRSLALQPRRAARRRGALPMKVGARRCPRVSSPTRPSVLHRLHANFPREDRHQPLGFDSASTCSTRWRTTPRTRWTRRSSPRRLERHGLADKRPRSPAHSDKSNVELTVYEKYANR